MVTLFGSRVYKNNLLCVFSNVFSFQSKSESPFQFPKKGRLDGEVCVCLRFDLTL
jgi:hypothetical protein